MKNVKTNSTPKNIPFEFIFDYLLPIEIIVKQMFGMHAIYNGERLLLILRQRKDHPEQNGIWVATSGKRVESLEKDLPSLIPLVGDKKSDWRLLPVDSQDFEEAAGKIYELIVASDSRIGKITASASRSAVSKKRKKETSSATI